MLIFSRKNCLFFFIFSISLFSFFLNSCKNANHNQLDISENNLKKMIVAKDEKIEWTTELEKNRLSQKINSIDYVRSGNSLTPSTMIAFESSISRPPVFPSLDNFGSLDISDIDANAIFLVNEFCKNLKSQNDCSIFMNENSIFSLVLFLYDLKKINFSFENFSFIIGKSFNSENFLEIPVRFINNEKNLDLKIYLQSSDENPLEYKILDIEIFGLKNIEKNSEGSDGK